MYVLKVTFFKSKNVKQALLIRPPKLKEINDT